MPNNNTPKLDPALVGEYWKNLAILESLRGALAKMYTSQMLAAVEQITAQDKRTTESFAVLQSIATEAGCKLTGLDSPPYQLGLEKLGAEPINDAHPSLTLVPKA